MAWGAVKKANQLGAKVVAISGPDGVFSIPDLITDEMNEYMLEMRSSNRDRVEDMAVKFPDRATFIPGKKSWSIPCDIALPCAFQNELDEEDAKPKANAAGRCEVSTWLPSEAIISSEHGDFPPERPSMQRCNICLNDRMQPISVGLPLKWTASCIGSCRISTSSA